MDLSNVLKGLRTAMAAKLARWVGTLLGGAAAAWLADHAGVLNFLNQACASLSSTEAMEGFAGAAAVAAVTLLSSIRDGKNVNAKMAVTAAAAFDKGQALALQTAMQQGAEVQASTDQAKIAAVASAMAEANTATKTDKASLVAALKSGTF
jgi:hypothetical protein